MRNRSRPLLRIALPGVLLVGLPLLGATLAGLPPGRFLGLPPELPQSPAEPFSWRAFGLIGLLIALTLAPFLVALLGSRRPGPRYRWGRLPVWGWLGGLLLLSAWWIAWHRYDWARPLQAHSFTPIWLGYILLVNALVQARTGSCLMRAHPGLFLALFPASSLFWWLFEYLNRFVLNWRYSGSGADDPLGHVISASLPFSTVLPAVLSTRDLLASFPGLHAGLARGLALPVRRRGAARAVLAAAAAGLILLPACPELLFPLVWVLPLLLVVAVQVLLGEGSPLDPLVEGDWRPLWLAALAALVCGFFWELWNWHSLARWAYRIDFVGRFHLFEMPLLGYAGYIPFGLECLAAATLLFGARREIVYGVVLDRY